MRKFLLLLLLLLANYRFLSAQQNHAEQMLEKLVLAAENKRYGAYDYVSKVKINTKDTVISNFTVYFDKRNKLNFYVAFNEYKSLWFNYSVEYRINHQEKNYTKMSFPILEDYGTANLALIMPEQFLKKQTKIAKRKDLQLHTVRLPNETLNKQECYVFKRTSSIDSLLYQIFYFRTKDSVLIRKGNYDLHETGNSFQYNYFNYRPETFDWENALPNDYVKVKAERYKAPKQIAKGDLAPDWELPQAQGGDFVSLHQYRGKVVLLDFWYIGCLPCIKAMPFIKELHDKYQNREDFAIISINTSDQPEAVQKYLAQKPKPYTTLVQGEQVQRELYGANANPAFYIIDQEGKIAYQTMGYNDKREKAIRKVLKKLLRE